MSNTPPSGGNIPNNNGLEMGSIPGYTKGFTPPEAFITDPNDQSQYGVRIDNTNQNTQSSDPTTILENKESTFTAFNDNEEFDFTTSVSPLQSGQDQFSTVIPSGTDTTGGTSQDIYLASFVSTPDTNEDPIIFGYDLILNTITSPLFNGSVETFISQFGTNYSELSSRMADIVNFKNQFFKFFKINSPSLISSNPKNYYLKKLSGIHNLTEQLSSDKSKQFVKYGEDLITLTLYEDVSLNIGYLATLYKMLSWSRLNGKKMIPDNLLRFDAQIVIKELRNYNRYTRNSDNTLNVSADQLTKYTYNLYECQMFFPKLSHEDSIDMWNSTSKLNEQEIEISFNYKYSTLKFELYNPTYVFLDNSLVNISSLNSQNSNSASINSNGISVNMPQTTYTPYTTIPKQTANQQTANLNNQVTSGQLDTNPTSPIDQLNNNNISNPQSPLSQFAQSAANAGIQVLNKQIQTQALLLQNTLNNITESAGINSMTPPKNIYYDDLGNLIGPTTPFQNINL